MRQVGDTPGRLSGASGQVFHFRCCACARLAHRPGFGCLHGHVEGEDVRTVSKIAYELPNLIDVLRMAPQVLKAPGDIASLCAYVLETLASTCQGRRTVLYMTQDLLSHRGKTHSAFGGPPDRGGKLNGVCGKLVYGGCTLGNMRRLAVDHGACLFEYLMVSLPHERPQ
jgi:hypothetical protein